MSYLILYWSNDTPAIKRSFSLSIYKPSKIPIKKHTIHQNDKCIVKYCPLPAGIPSTTPSM